MLLLNDEPVNNGKDRSLKFKDDVVYYWFLDSGDRVKIGIKKSQTPGSYANDNGMKYLYKA